MLKGVIDSAPIELGGAMGGAESRVGIPAVVDADGITVTGTCPAAGKEVIVLI